MRKGIKSILAGLGFIVAGLASTTFGGCPLASELECRLNPNACVEALDPGDLQIVEQMAL